MSDRRLFTLSDPHLSFARPKPMEVFGPLWRDHTERLADNWRAAVGEDDIVLMPGDISWAMRLEEAKADLEWLSRLPGRKVLLKGNHDYWWQSLAKMKALALPGLHFVQANHVLLDDVAVGGTRLWDFPDIKWPYVPREGGGEGAGAPGMEMEAKEDREGDPEKLRARELGRLAASLETLPAGAGVKVAMTHYPPLGEDGLPTRLTDLIGSYGVDICVFGHVHGAGLGPRPGEDVLIGKTRYVLASCDVIGMTPKRLL